MATLSEIASAATKSGKKEALEDFFAIAKIVPPFFFVANMNGSAPENALVF